MADVSFHPPRKYLIFITKKTLSLIQEQSSYYHEGEKLKKFGEEFLSEENIQEIPSYSQLSDLDIGVPFQSEAEINAGKQCKNKM